MTEHQTTIESFEQQIEDVISCHICLETMQDPKVLQCQHSFCCACLQTLVRLNQGHAIACPTCRAQTTLPRDGAHKLPSDFKVKKLSELNMAGIKRLRSQMEKLSVDLDASKAPSQKYNSCSICRQKSGWYCKDCRGYLCAACCENHRQTRVFRDHTITAGQGHEQDLCKTHPGNPQEYLCKDCFLVICNFCVIEKHRACDVIQTNEYVKDCHQVIETSLLQLEDIQGEIGRREKTVDEGAYCQFNRSVSEVIDQITRAAKERTRRIEEEKERLLSSVQENKDKLEQMLQHAEERKGSKTKVSELRSRCAAFLTTRTVTDILSDFEDLSSDIVSTICTVLDHSAHPALTPVSVPSQFEEEPSAVSMGTIWWGTVDVFQSPSSQ